MQQQLDNAAEDAPVTTPPQVRVKVTLGAGGIPEVTSTHRVPNKQLVLSCLPVAIRRSIPRRYSNSTYYSLLDCMTVTRESISLQLWSDAIGEATLRALSMTTVGETNLRDVASGGYLAIGDSLYKISPVQHLPMTKAIAAMKRSVRERVNREAEVLMVNAQAAAKAVTADAVKLREAAVMELERAKQNQQLVPPSALASAGLRLKYVNQHWHVGMDMKLGFSGGFDFSCNVRGPEGTLVVLKKHWAPVVSAVPPNVNVVLWIPMARDGSFSATAVYVDKSSPLLPHIGHESGCMGLASGPTRILSREDVDRLRIVMQDCHSTVNLASLLISPSCWVPTFKPWIPDELQRMFAGTAWKDRLIANMQAEYTARQRPLADTNTGLVTQVTLPPARTFDEAQDALSEASETWEVADA